MLMPSSASVRNICAAMPACERMPMPTIDTLQMRSSPMTSRRLDVRLHLRLQQDLHRLRVVVAVHGEREVGHAVVADVLHDHVDVDVGVGDRARGSRRRCRAGRARPCTVILASSRLNAMPEMTACSMLVVFLESDQRARLRPPPRPACPGSVKLESTRSGTLYLPANSTERICSTLEPSARHLEHLLEGDRVAGGAPRARCAGRWCRRRRRRCRSGTRRPSAPRRAPPPRCPSRRGRAW